jgi:hypothetical protein
LRVTASYFYFADEPRHLVGLASLVDRLVIRIVDVDPSEMVFLNQRQTDFAGSKYRRCSGQKSVVPARNFASASRFMSLPARSSDAAQQTPDKGAQPMGLFSKDIKSMDDLFLHTLQDLKMTHAVRFANSIVGSY